MSAPIRFGMALETGTLLAADSFHRWLRLSSGATAAQGSALTVDPEARDQFVRVVDLFLDRPPYYLISSNLKLPQPSAVGELVRTTAQHISEPGTKMVLTQPVQTELYRQFLQLFAHTPEFQTAAIRWAGFQLLSADVLQGHVIRMDVPYGHPLVDAAARSAFAQALRTVEGAEPQAILEKAHATASDFGFQALLKAPAQGFDALGLRHLTFGKAYIQGLLYEVQTYRDLARTLHLAAEADLALFLLAYLGRACIQGWQNLELLSRQTPTVDLVYLAHHVRSTFLFHSRQQFHFSPRAPARRNWWSWGGLLAQAVVSNPAKWPAQAVHDTLQALHASLDKNGLSTSMDSSDASGPFKPTEEQLRLLQSLAREHTIILASDEAKDRLLAWAPAFVQLLLTGSVDDVLRLLSMLTEAPIDDEFAQALWSQAPSAWEAFFGTGSTSPSAAIFSQRASWLMGARGGLRPLYSVWDGTLDNQLASVELSGSGLTSH
jgi:hypothetical protein